MNIKVPYILTCMVTGIQKSYTSVDFVKRKIENYGGDEAKMIAGYVCKDAKRELKSFDIDKLTVADVEAVIKKLGGTADPQKAFDLIKGGTLFLTKKVKVVAGKKGGKGKSKGKAKSAKKPAKGKSKGKKAKKADAPADSSTPPAGEPPAAAPTTPDAPPADGAPQS